MPSCPRKVPASGASSAASQRMSCEKKLSQSSSLPVSAAWFVAKTTSRASRTLGPSVIRPESTPWSRAEDDAEQERSRIHGERNPARRSAALLHVIGSERVPLGGGLRCDLGCDILLARRVRR